ncbi:MAG: hypothetical protein WCA04_07215 [Geobacteraceae bacterium]
MRQQHTLRRFVRSGSAFFAALVGVVLLFSATVKASSDRPRAGQGILLLRPAFAEQADSLKTLVLYETPGIRRVAMINAARLPSLSLVLPVPTGVYAVAVMGKRGNWFRLAYDESGREGWIKGRQYWNYYRWTDFLPGCFVRFLPELRASLTEFHQEPYDRSPSLGTIAPGQRMYVMEISNRWAKIRSDNDKHGWIRWCDGNGKLLIALEKFKVQPYQIP